VPPRYDNQVEPGAVGDDDGGQCWFSYARPATR
jgi:hypothetical protein